MVAPPYPDSKGAESLSEQFGLLSADSRRFLLSYLSSSDTEPTVDRLADELAEWHGSRSSKEMRRHELSLQHIHLPRLQDDGAVEVEGGVAILTDKGRETEEIRRVATERLRQG